MVVPITIDNSQSTQTGTYQQLLAVDSLQYSAYINSNWTNVRFQYTNGTSIPAWIEGNASNTSGNTPVWLRLYSIPAGTSETIYMLIDSKSSFDLSPTGPTGEAPQLSSSYGKFDNGASVFVFYDNFAGTTLSATNWQSPIGSQGSVSVNNGATFTTTSSSGYIFIVAAAKIAYPAITEMLYDPAGNATSQVGALIGETKNTDLSSWIDLCPGYETDWEANVADSSQLVVSYSPTSCSYTLIKSGFTTPSPDSIPGFAWVATGNEQAYLNYSDTQSATNGKISIAKYYPYAGISNLVPGSYSVQWIRARAYPPNGVMPSAIYGTALVAGAPSATPNPVDSGQATTISTTAATGGSGSYTYTWSGSVPTGCTLPSGTSTTSFGCTPSGYTSPATFTITVTYGDSSGNSVQNSFTLTVDPALSAPGTPTATVNPVDVGQQTVLTATAATGGSGPYTYSWSGLPTGCSSSNALTLDCTPTSVGSGTYTITVTATDGNGQTATSGALTLTVDSALTAGTPSATPNPVDSGQATTISTTAATGGSGGYTYTWSGSVPTGCALPSGTSTTSFGCTPSGYTSTATFTITVTYGDSSGNSVQNSFTLTVDGAIASLTLSPSSGPSGVTVTATVAGFASTDTSVALTSPSSTALCTIISLTNGGGSCTFAPTSSNGFSFSSGGISNTVTATGNKASDAATATFTGTVTSLTLAPSSGPSGVTVTATVSGFASTDTSIAVTGPTSMKLCTITVSPAGSGSGSCGFTANAGNGLTFSSSGTANTVTATGSVASDSATATFTGTMPTLSLSPSSGPSGVTVTVSGSGFASADSHITLSNPTDPSLAVCALSSGTISGPCSFVANSANGFSFSSGGSSVVVTATGNAAGDTQTATFTGTIASLTLTPSSGPSGVTVTVTAAGFASTDTSIAVAIGSNSLCTITASGGGGSCTFVPTSSNGFTFSLSGAPNTLTATGSAAGDGQTAIFTGTTPAITVTPGQGPVGSTVTVAGTGFPVNTALASLLFDGVTISSCASGSTTADGAGHFSCQLRVPTGTSGTSVAATASTGQVASGTFTVTTPAIALSPEQGPAGSEVTVAGTGFSTDATLQSLVFDSVAITSCASGSLATTATGSFDCQFTVPTGTSGTSVVATDPGGARASGTFAVTIPSLSIEPTSGATGATVTASGSGFTVSSSIQFSINNGGTISSATACTTSPTGAFDGCTFSVSGPIHSYTITATDSSHSTATAAYSIVFLYALTFTESGLPNGTTWAVTVGNNAQSSSGSTITFPLQNGTYPYAISDVPGWHQTSLAYTGSVTVKGSSVSEPTLRFAQVTYQVTFSETGIPVGTTWWVNLTNGQSREGTGGSTIIFLEPNGSYVYSVSASPDTYAAPGGTFDVSGAALSILVPFSSTYYPVTFSETGLPAGVQWWVNLTGGPSGSSTTRTLTLSLVNGTWQYTVAAANPSYRATSGTFTVSGAARSVSITFAAYYSVTFTESGLPSGTSWQVTVDGVTQKAVAGISIVFSEPNGSYAYQIGDVSGWHQSAVPYSGTVTVRGSPIAYPTLAFVQVLYTVTFLESGLPAGTLWFVNITNGPSFHGTNSTLVFTEPNGTFGYQVTSPGYSASPSSGTFVVSGAPSVVGVTFTLVTFSVTFTESGLPGGTSWAVIVNGENRSSTGGTIVFQEANGSYQFTVYSSNPLYQAKGGPFTVHGSGVVIVVSFFSKTYSVVFSETGLPLGTSWSVTFNGATNRSSGGIIGFESVNGTFPFTVGGVAGYAANPSSGTVNVRGSAVLVSIDFTIAVYALTFSQSGLPASTVWNVTIDGTVHYSSGSNVTVSLPNGTYDFAIASVRYVAEPGSGTVVIAGTARSVSVTFVVGYTVTVHRPGGIANGTVWNAALTGQALPVSAEEAALLATLPINVTRSSTGPTIAFLEPAGTYTWAVTISGKPGYFAAGTVSPSALNPNPAVVPPPVSGPPSGLAGIGALLLAWLPYIAIAVAAALAAFAVLVVAGRRRKRRAAEPRSEEYFEAYLPLPAVEPGAPSPPLFEAYVPAPGSARAPSAELMLKPEPPSSLLTIWNPEDESSPKAPEPSEPPAAPGEPSRLSTEPPTEPTRGAKDKPGNADALLEDWVPDDE